jgi:hypothetical protein
MQQAKPQPTGSPRTHLQAGLEVLDLGRRHVDAHQLSALRVVDHRVRQGLDAGLLGRALELLDADLWGG